MRRIFTAAAVAVALALPSSVAIVGLSAPVGAAGSSVTCHSLKGTFTGTITIKSCSPKSKPNKSVSGAATQLATGGTLTWTTSGQTTVIGSMVIVNVGQGGCKTGASEYNASGVVTGGNSTYTHVGDVVSAKACVLAKNGKVSAVPGSSVSL